MTIKELAHNSNVSEKQIMKRWCEIGGVTKDEEGLHFPEGTRYPARKLHNIRSSDEKAYALLKAIANYRYIDAHMLRLTPESFSFLLTELENAGWIAENSTNNCFGANRYDATLAGSKVSRSGRKKSIGNIELLPWRICKRNLTAQLIFAYN